MDDDDESDSTHTKRAKMRSSLTPLDRKKQKLLNSFHALLHKSLMFFKQFQHERTMDDHRRRHGVGVMDTDFNGSGRSSVSRFQAPFHDGDEDDDDTINSRFMKEGL